MASFGRLKSSRSGVSIQHIRSGLFTWTGTGTFTRHSSAVALALSCVSTAQITNGGVPWTLRHRFVQPAGFIGGAGFSNRFRAISGFLVLVRSYRQWSSFALIPSFVFWWAAKRMNDTVPRLASPWLLSSSYFRSCQPHRTILAEGLFFTDANYADHKRH